MNHTDTQAALLSAICADPGDMTARLVYADACEERGDMVRAEFIRTQLRRWELDPYHLSCTGGKCGLVECNELREQERELLTGYGSDAWGGWNGSVGHNWIATLGPVVKNPHAGVGLLRRGFVENVSCTCASWQSHGPAIVRQTPVREVRLVDYDSVQLLGDYYAVMPLVVRYSWITGLAHLFASEEDARAENERRALQWARHAAGLPRWESKRHYFGEGANEMKCGIKHGFHDGTCIREKGHDGNCRCKAERMADGLIMYSEWLSKDGKFYRHVGYQSIYPKNAKKS